MHRFHILTTEQFWEEMCNPRSLRLSFNQLARGQHLFYTAAPPNIKWTANKVNEIHGLLGAGATPFRPADKPQRGFFSRIRRSKRDG